MSAMQTQRRVLAIGPVMAVLAKQALHGAQLDIAAPDVTALAALGSALDLVLIDTDAAGPDLALGLIEAISLQSDAPAVLLVGAHLPTNLVRALLKLDRSDVLEAPVTFEELARAAVAVLAERPGAHGHSSRCWSIVGAVGGCGATTIAIELAATLAKRATQPGGVALVDLNLADGAASAYLGARANMQLAEASAEPERIDAALVDAFAVRVEAGFDLLACPRDPQAFTRISPDVVRRVLDLACHTYDWVIVDLPRLRQPWSLDLLAGSDEILVVSELTVPALLSARAVAGEIEAELPEGRRSRVILNRMSNRAFGAAPSRAEAEKALQRKVDGSVTSDWEAAACSVNLGGPINQHRPRSKIVKDIAALVDRLAVQPARAADRSSMVG